MIRCPICHDEFPDAVDKIPPHPGRLLKDGTRARTCPGSMRDTNVQVCKSCGGDGYFKGARLGDEPCPACNGSGIEDRSPYPVPPFAKIRIDSTFKQEAVNQLATQPKVIQLEKGKFNSCPFCASDNLWVRIDRKGRSYVECSGCCAHGPILNDILDAVNDERAIGQIIERWNTRKQP